MSVPQNPDDEIGRPPKKLSIIVFSGTFEKAHYALVMASAAAAVDTPVTLFFTMDATRAVAGSEDHPGWRALPRDEIGQETGSVTDRKFGEKNVATFEELLEACKAMDVTFMVCEMGMRAMGLGREQLRPDIPFEVGGVVSFLNDARDDGSMIFI